MKKLIVLIALSLSSYSAFANDEADLDVNAFLQNVENSISVDTPVEDDADANEMEAESKMENDPLGDLEVTATHPWRFLGCVHHRQQCRFRAIRGRYTHYALTTARRLCGPWMKACWAHRRHHRPYPSNP